MRLFEHVGSEGEECIWSGITGRIEMTAIYPESLNPQRSGEITLAER